MAVALGRFLLVLGLGIGVACAPVAATPTPSPVPTASPVPTFSPEQLQMLAFIRDYAVIRDDYLRGQPKPSGAFTAAEAISLYRQRWNFTNGIAQRVLSLSRNPMTRAFIDDAENATLDQASSEELWYDTWSGRYTAAGLTADLANANELSATAARLWRELDDRIEDTLTRVGLDWSPVGGRPPAWRATLQP